MCALPLRDAAGSFVLMACDGVWKTFGVDAAAAFVMSALDQATAVHLSLSRMHCHECISWPSDHCIFCVTV